MGAQGYIGRSPGDSSNIIARQTYTPTGITTNFTFASTYSVGYIDAYLNGVRLVEGNDFTATDGSVVGLTTHAQNGDIIELVAYKTFNATNVTAANNDFSVAGDLSVTGVSTFTGAITATGGITGSVTGDATGLSGTPDITIRNLTGVAATFTGVLSYDDVTNVDSIGFATFRSGINVQGAGSTTTTLNVSGVTTMTGDANFGSVLNIDDSIVHSGDSNTKIRFPAADTFTVETSGSEAFRVDSSQRLLVNTTSEMETFGSAALQVATSAGGTLVLGRDDTSVSEDNGLGAIYFDTKAGGSFAESAVIAAEADAAQGSGDYPSRLVFKTTADGAGSVTERVRITSAGDVGIGEDSPADRLVVQETNASGDVAVRIKNDTLTDGSATNPTTASLYLNTSTGDFNSFYIQARRTDNDTHLGYANPRDGGHTPSMVITNDRQVAIGTATIYANANCDDLIVGNRNSNEQGITIGSKNQGQLAFADIGDDRAGLIHYQHTDNSMRFMTNGASNERLRITSAGRIRHQNSGGETIHEMRRTDANTTGAVGTINFTASDSHSVASIGALGDGDNEGAHIIFRTTSAAADNSPYNAATPEVARIDSGGRLLVGATSALDTTAGAITSNNSSSGGRLALGGNPSSAGSSVGEVFGWWNGNKVGGLLIASGADTTNKDDGELRFYTSESGPSVQERMRIERSGNIGINETSAPYKLSIANGDVSSTRTVSASGGNAVNMMRFRVENSSNTTQKATLGGISAETVSGWGGTLTFHTKPANGTPNESVTERLRIDSSGKVLIGNGLTSRTVAGISCPLHVEGTGATDSSICLVRNTNGATNPPYLLFGKSRSSSTGGTTIVQNGDLLGYLGWQAADGNDLDGTAAAIQALVDATPGSNDVPGRLELMTTDDGNNSPTWRLRLDKSGKLFLNSITGNAASGSALKYNNSDKEVRYDTSSRLLKTNITECTYGIETIKKLKPSRYTPQEYDKEGNITVSNESCIGFIADEMLEDVPEVVQMYPKFTLTKNVEDTELVPAAISYDKLTPVLTKALQEAIAKIETLEQRLTDAGL